MSGNSPIVSLERLKKSVPGGRVLFEGMDLTVERGEFIAIKGESGAGKSTLLNLIAGLDLADQGRVTIDGVGLDTLDDTQRTRLRREKIGFVFQAFHLLPHLTLAQNVALPLVLLHEEAKRASSRANDLLAAVGLAGRGGHYPQVLSGGELQRVAIARALVHGPSLILADEPTGNLDPETAQRILDLFASEVSRAGAATILVTHSGVAAAIAGRRLTLTRDGVMRDDD
jgi:putative ABC transport system ATP-binding protein